MKSSKGENDKRSGRATKTTVLSESPPKYRTRTSPSRSPARGRKQSPGPRISRRSPARKSPTRKSPGRKSPSRKSPSRKSPARKSPARKSPSRNSKEADDNSKSPSRRPAIKNENVKNSEKLTNASVKLEITRLATKPRRNSSEYLAKNVQLEPIDIFNGKELPNAALDGLRERKSKVSEDWSSKIASRRSTRLKEATDNYELMRLAQSTKLPKSDRLFENFSDSESFSDDESIPKKEKSITRNLITPLREMSVPRDKREFGGLVGVLFQMVFMPLFVVGVNLICNNSRCSFTSWPKLQPLGKLENWINLKSLLLYFSFVLLQVLVSLIPYFGKKVVLPDKKPNFYANGAFSLFVTSSLIIGLEYFNIPVFFLIYTQYFTLMITASIYGLSMAVALFVLSRKVPNETRNSFGNTGIALYDFWMGREVNPCLFRKLHVKLIFLRTALIAALMLNVVTLYHGISVKNFPIISSETLSELETYKQIVKSIIISPTLLVFVSIQILYFIHAIIGEAKMITTFEYQYEGTGLMVSLGYSLYPFTTPSITRYILEHNVVLPSTALVAVVALYLIGFYIFLSSNAQKSAFRENPMDPKLSHLDSLPTFQGKRLLISGWWGAVRHPNYLGDILLHLSWAAGALTAPPVLFILATVLFLMHRATRDAQRCRRKYGTAWDRYCQRVPYKVFPKVF